MGEEEQIGGAEQSREGWSESAPNPTQERIDREPDEGRPADASWDEDAWGETKEKSPG